MTTITGHNRGTGARPLAALLALLLLGLALASPAEPAAAKRTAKAGNGKGRANGGRRTARRATVRKYVARAAQNSEPSPFVRERDATRAILLVRLNARNVPVKVVSLRLLGTSAQCGERSLRHPGDPGDVIHLGWAYPRAISVGSATSEGVRAPAFNDRFKRGGETGAAMGAFSDGIRSLSLLVEREFTPAGSDARCSIYERLGGALVPVKGKRKGARDRGGAGKGARGRGGRTG